MKKYLFALALALSPAVGNPYEKNDNNLTSRVVHQLQENQEDVYAYFSYDIGGKNIEIGAKGGGTILKDEDTGEFYILTAQHLVDNTASKLLGGVNRTVKVGEKSLEAIVVKEDVLSDLALIKLPYCTKDYFKGKIGEAEIGDFLIVWGYEGGSVRNFKTGHAGSKYKTGFIHSVPTNPGNSGSGVFALDGLGRLVLVGVASEYVDKQQNVSLAVGYERIREFLLGTGLEDEYLGGGEDEP